MDALVGDLLGDGHIRLKTYKDGNFIGRLEFTFSVKNLPYLRYLKFIIYQEICTLTEPTPWPNPKTDKIVTQYWFSSRYLAMFVQLHSEWYEKVGVKNIKKVPLNTKELLKPVGLTHWIMGDGYWKGKTVEICTDNFTYEEVILLADIIE